MTFSLSDTQQRQADEWMQQQMTKENVYMGAAGGRFSFEFTPCGLGILVVVKDNGLKEELNITDFEEW